MVKEIKETPWVVAGGKIGELAHCTHCGEGLISPGIPGPFYRVISDRKDRNQQLKTPYPETPPKDYHDARLHPAKASEHQGPLH